MRQVADITLIENSSAGNPPKTFTGQTVEIRQVDDVVVMGADGKISMGKQPSTVKWFGGTAADFEHITDVRIVTVSGNILVDSEVLRNIERPHAITGGVQFQVSI